MTAGTQSAPFTKAEAEAFVKKLFSEIFSKGNPAAVGDFYTEDVIGHYQNEVFRLKDIQNRALAIKQNAKNVQFIVHNVVLVSPDYIAMSCKQLWTNKNDGSLYDSLVFGLYRIENRKIAELWIIQECKTESYTEVNHDFAKSMRPFELNQKAKYQFLQRLNLKQTETGITLSEMEKDSLYYYFHGFSAKEAGLAMQISPRTVESYLANVKEKLGCNSKRELRKKLFPDLKES